MPFWDEFQRGLEAASRETAHVRMPEAASHRVCSRLADAMAAEHQPTRRPTARWFAACATADLAATVGQDGLVEIQSGGCVLKDDTWGGSLRPERKTRLKREGSAIRVLSGQVVVNVNQRLPGAPGTFAAEVQRAQAKLGCAAPTAPTKKERP